MRKERALSQARLGQHAGLSGKFIGEVERGSKSISVDSLYHVAVALKVPLRDLTDLSGNHRPRHHAIEQILALVSSGLSPAQVHRA